MKRIDFFKLLGLAAILPKSVKGEKWGNPIKSKTIEVSQNRIFPLSSQRGMTDVLTELGLYEELKGIMYEEVETVNGVDVIHSNKVQVFRSQHTERQEAFDKIKEWVDLGLIYNEKSTVSCSDNGNITGTGHIQLMGGLNWFIKQSGAVLDVDNSGLTNLPYGPKFLGQIIATLIRIKSPRHYLIVSPRGEYERLMGSFKNLGSSGITSLYPGRPYWDRITYGGFTFDFTHIDNIAHPCSYAIPLSKVKMKNGEIKNRFGGRYVKYQGDVYTEIKTKDRTEFATVQCLQVLGAEYFIKINHPTKNFKNRFPYINPENYLS